jgi:hypothetical protein
MEKQIRITLFLFATVVVMSVFLYHQATKMEAEKEKYQEQDTFLILKQ